MAAGQQPQRVRWWECWKGLGVAAGAILTPLAVVLSISTTAAPAQEPPQDWLVEPQTTRIELLKEVQKQKAKGRSDANFYPGPGLSWPDGRQAVALYFELPDGVLYRCWDNFLADMTYTGGLCYRLVGARP